MNRSASTLFFIFIFSTCILPQNTFEFLRIDMSARAAALAGSFLTNGDDPDVIFYNPAGIQLLENDPVSFSFVKHLLDINLASLSYSHEFENIGRIGAAVRYINYGTFTEADRFGNRLDEFSANEFAFIAGYANALDDNFYYGGNVKFIYSGIADRSSTGIAFDVGLHYEFPTQNINIGFSAMNIGSQLSSYYDTEEELPLDLAIGVSKRLEYLPLRISLDFHKLNEDREDFIGRLKAFSVGAEFQLSKVLQLRVGYDNEKRKELKIGTSSGIAGFNVGIGALVSKYRFDYGYSSMGDIGALHRVSLSTSL